MYWGARLIASSLCPVPTLPAGPRRATLSDGILTTVDASYALGTNTDDHSESVLVRKTNRM